MYEYMDESFKWMPKWIGKRYSKLWSDFKECIFTYDEVKEELGEYTSNYLSEMKRSHSLYIFLKHGKKREYRLVPPQLYIYSYTNKVKLDWLIKGRYANLILKFFRLLKDELEDNLLSLGIFGSVARGEAKKDSDIDLFIIVNELNMSLLERTKYLLNIKRKDSIKKELEFLSIYEIHPRLNFFLRQKNELTLNFFTIDISFDIKTVYDKGILRTFLEKIQRKIEEKDIKRKYLENGKYYLDLNIEFGEVFEF